MLHIKIKDQDFQFDYHQGEAILQGKAVNADAIKLAPNKYHVLINHQSYTIELLEKSENGKIMQILVNGVKQEVSIKDKYDALLSQLGMDKLMSTKANVVKAPMPGLVLRVQVKVGDAIKKGDALLVLEAMKMENVIKAEGEGIVKAIKVNEKQAVEKNTLLIEME